MGEIELGQLLPEFWLDYLSAVATFGKFYPYCPQNQKDASFVFHLLFPSFSKTVRNCIASSSQTQKNDANYVKLHFQLSRRAIEVLLNHSEYPELIVEGASLNNLVLYIRNLWLDAECRVPYSYGTLCMQHMYGRNTEGAVHTEVTVMLDSHQIIRLS